MILESPVDQPRALRRLTIDSDLVVIGGGLAGTCAAIAAARSGIQVILVQDRPVLGGNASSEVRLWALGATSHMGNNNRWSREGGIVDEILVENLFRNREGNSLIFDALLLEKVRVEPNIRLLLNTAACGVELVEPGKISLVRAFCSQNSTEYELRAPLFCDASGDGILGFQAGAAFRMGAESTEEFGEGFAPDRGFGELLGHTIYFYSKDVGRPVKFVPPAFALKDITRIPRFKEIKLHHHGCNFWWIEFGGRLDTIHETEEIKWELWKIVYGIWDHVKNSGEFPGAETMTLEWVGTIPGKRESRRFEGDYMLKQQDVVEQRTHPDAVATGGWSLDLHPADAVYGSGPSCMQWHSKGVYSIPYRCYYSRNVSNLFLAGRLISASHVAFGSSRVMLTCAHGGVAVGVAAACCTRDRLLPRDLTEPTRMRGLQAELNHLGQSIPGIPSCQQNNLAAQARIEASSTFKLAVIPESDASWRRLDFPLAQLLPFEPGYAPKVTLRVRSEEETELVVSLRTSIRPENYTPEVTLEEIRVPLRIGDQTLTLPFSQSVEEATYVFLTLAANPAVEVPRSDFRCTGLLSVENKFDRKVAVSGEQNPPTDIGVDRFEFWLPTRRPDGHNLALALDPPLSAFSSTFLTNGWNRPWKRTNAWVADPMDAHPFLELHWDEAVSIREIDLHFDTDFDHAMETSQWGHPEDIMPFCIREYRVIDDQGRTIHEVRDNHQTISRIRLEAPLETQSLRIELNHPIPGVPASLFAVWVR
ncbi:MAG: FAD-dependent oxidoreductase [Akkermansiaceae bacterium]|jgi:hypothetical protein|nr:FAD-dependent oxidoreductase [Akkermansiaceae bacterium]